MQFLQPPIIELTSEFRIQLVTDPKINDTLEVAEVLLFPPSITDCVEDITVVKGEPTKLQFDWQKVKLDEDVMPVLAAFPNAT